MQVVVGFVTIFVISRRVFYCSFLKFFSLSTLVLIMVYFLFSLGRVLFFSTFIKISIILVLVERFLTELTFGVSSSLLDRSIIAIYFW